MSDLREEDKYSMGLYLIKSGREEMQIQDIKELLEQTYWANMRDIETIKNLLIIPCAMAHF